MHITLEEALGIAARGYCTPENKHKVLDPVLCEAIAQEIIKSVNPPPEKPILDRGE